MELLTTNNQPINTPASLAILSQDTYYEMELDRFHQSLDAIQDIVVLCDLHKKIKSVERMRTLYDELKSRTKQLLKMQISIICKIIKHNDYIKGKTLSGPEHIAAEYFCKLTDTQIYELIESHSCTTPRALYNRIRNEKAEDEYREYSIKRKSEYNNDSYSEIGNNNQKSDDPMNLNEFIYMAHRKIDSAISLTGEVSIDNILSEVAKMDLQYSNSGLQILKQNFREYIRNKYDVVRITKLKNDGVYRKIGFATPEQISDDLNDKIMRVVYDLRAIKKRIAYVCEPNDEAQRIVYEAALSIPDET